MCVCLVPVAVGSWLKELLLCGNLLHYWWQCFKYFKCIPSPSMQLLVASHVTWYENKLVVTLNMDGLIDASYTLSQVSFQSTQSFSTKLIFILHLMEANSCPVGEGK